MIANDKMHPYFPINYVIWMTKNIDTLFGWVFYILYFFWLLNFHYINIDIAQGNQLWIYSSLEQSNFIGVGTMCL